MAFVNEKENRKTIDYDRNVYLVHKSTLRHDGAPTIAVFQLNWNGDEIIFHAIKNFIKEKSDSGIINWDITHIFGKPALKIKQKELQNLIEEALYVYGYLYEWKYISKVNIKFSNKLSWQPI